MKQKTLTLIDKILKIRVMQTPDADKAEKSFFMYSNAGGAIYYCTLLGFINSILFRLPGERVIVKVYEDYDGERNEELLNIEFVKKWW